jgi:hypothetical protein
MRTGKRRKTAKNAPKTPIRGRPKLYGRRIVLPLADGTLADIDAVIGAGETRLDVIRSAIEREIERRIRS